MYIYSKIYIGTFETIERSPVSLKRSCFLKKSQKKTDDGQRTWPVISSLSSNMIQQIRMLGGMGEEEECPQGGALSRYLCMYVCMYVCIEREREKERERETLN